MSFYLFRVSLHFPGLVSSRAAFAFVDPIAARKQEILKLTEQLLEAISAGDYETYA